MPAFTNQLSYIYAYIGAHDRGLEDPERAIAERKYLPTVQIRHVWSPEYAPVRKTGRFKALVRATEYVEYWRAKGWPEFCHSTTADDFVCE